MADETGDTEDKGTAWWKWWRRRNEKRFQSPPCAPLQNAPPAMKTSLREWHRVIEQLQPYIRSMRSEIDGLAIHDLTFDVLGAGTFLLQIDLLLIKIRQHFTNYERRKSELNQRIPAIKEILDKVETGCIQCHQIMTRLKLLLEGCTFRDLNKSQVIEQVRLLESETKGLTECMHAMNEMALKRDPLYQLFEAELFKTLIDLERNGRDQPKMSTPLFVSATSSPYRDKAQSIVDPEHKNIGFHLISLYDNLKRCSILYQNPVVSHSMDRFKKSIECYIDLANDSSDQQTLESAVHELYYCLESMRFTPLKGFHDKAKHTQKQFKACLEQSDFGQNCLKTLRMTAKGRLELKGKKEKF